VRVFATSEQHRLEKELAAQAELAYRRLIADWKPQRRKGAGAAPGRASSAARQDTTPHPALYLALTRTQTNSRKGAPTRPAT
jgi:hypothetical protein